MFVAKIYTREKKEILDVRHYSVFQNALADIAVKEMFENIPDELVETLGNPDIRCHSVSETTNIADDFEFRYTNGVIVYLGEICPVDKK